MSDPNPCLDCGMCCVQFRVSFYWGEADDAPGGCVPVELTEKLNLHLRCMNGTNEVPRRCVALEGRPGGRVSCKIYDRRPTTCREFPSHEADGSPNPKCNELRAHIGLAPLQPRASAGLAG
ncbi:YkgJ family cysteine cluster protein [Aromatoleum toluclasticum]|uniref:YkgJ family cysteine cluster protein n=1 Tax=Aromatoleum toluclasticum TaxID=92003 RepID=UPI00037A779A|nr:YkgJ family cysteine cluster protein [Aromatoleum toluclasticum]MCC4117168.1 YkgJ family cysteine cluster protein [Aromatoleum toluclasticum]